MVIVRLPGSAFIPSDILTVVAQEACRGFDVNGKSETANECRRRKRSTSACNFTAVRKLGARKMLCRTKCFPRRDDDGRSSRQTDADGPFLSTRGRDKNTSITAQAWFASSLLSVAVSSLSVNTSRLKKLLFLFSFSYRWTNITA